MSNRKLLTANGYVSYKRINNIFNISIGDSTLDGLIRHFIYTNEYAGTNFDYRQQSEHWEQRWSIVYDCTICLVFTKTECDIDTALSDKSSDIFMRSGTLICIGKDFNDGFYIDHVMVNDQKIIPEFIKNNGKFVNILIEANAQLAPIGD